MTILSRRDAIKGLAGLLGLAAVPSASWAANEPRFAPYATGRYRGPVPELAKLAGCTFRCPDDQLLLEALRSPRVEFFHCRFVGCGPIEFDGRDLTLSYCRLEETTLRLDRSRFTIDHCFFSWDLDRTGHDAIQAHDCSRDSGVSSLTHCTFLCNQRRRDGDVESGIFLNG